MKFPILASLGALTLLAACSSAPTPAPRPMPVASPTPAPAMPTGDGRVATVNFQPMSADFTEMGRTNLGPVAERMAANPQSRVVITTYGGPREAAVARQRGAVVRQSLIDRGVAAERIRVMNGRMMPNADVNGVQLQVQDGPTRRS